MFILKTIILICKLMYNNLIFEIMEKGTHGVDEKKFGELDYLGQARSINAQILGLERALNAHFKKADSEGKNFSESKEKFKLQLERLIERLK